MSEVLVVVADHNEERSEDRRAMRAHFVRTLEWLMNERGLSHRRFAAEAGLSNHTEITRWKTLGYEPRPETVFRIEEYFELSPGTLSRTLGYLPVSARKLEVKPGEFEVMVEADQILPKWGKEILLTSYREIMGSLDRRKPSHRS